MLLARLVSILAKSVNIGNKRVNTDIRVNNGQNQPMTARILDQSRLRNKNTEMIENSKNCKKMTKSDENVYITVPSIRPET